MKLNTLSFVKSYDGKIVENIEPEKKDVEGKVITSEIRTKVTLRDLIAMSLNQNREEILTAEDKARCFALGVKLWGNNKGILEVSVDEAAFLKERAGKNLAPLGYGRVCEAIEQASSHKEKV